MTWAIFSWFGWIAFAAAAVKTENIIVTYKIS
jgi:hypothetical protein